MRRKQQSSRLGEIGRYWLSRRPNSPVWCRTWFDAETRQTCRTSLGTDDFAAAGIALARWVTSNVATDRASPGDVTLARIFARYHERHGRHTIGADAQRVSLAMILKAIPEGMTASEFTLEAQRDTVRSLRARDYAAGSIKRGFGAAKGPSLNNRIGRKESG